MQELWVEKWRPKSLSGYVFKDESQKEQINAWIKEGSIPHLLLSGSAGVGKTTLAKILMFFSLTAVKKVEKSNGLLISL